jgi:ABC-type branched-subunit amino acid transport system substrate-binding protein
MGSIRDSSPSPPEEWWLRTIDRRTLLKRTGRTAAGLWLVGGIGGLAAACGGGDDTGGGGGGGGQLPATVKIGVITPTSGLAQFLGDITEPGVRAATQHINDEGLLPGTTVEYEIVNAPAEEGAEGAVNAYNQLAADPDVIGIIWACSTGLPETLAQIQRDQMPVIATNTDLVSGELLDPGTSPSVFQLVPPNLWLTEAMCEYAVDDRGYRSTALLYDPSVFSSPDLRDQFTGVAEESGLEVVGVEEFGIGTFDFGAPLQRLSDDAPECLFVYGLPDNTAAIVSGLADLDASYVDTPTAKSGEGWHPHILGSPIGLTVKWAELAGEAAKTGTVSAWYLGGLLTEPEVSPISGWVPEATGNKVTGGEEMPANAMWALLEAARQAGTTDRGAIVDKLPGLRVEFATLPFVLDADTHMGVTRDDILLMALERASGPAETDPPYVLGLELGPELQSPDFVGPTHLVRPTLEANRSAQPEHMAWVLENGEGTQCTKTPPDALGEDVEMTAACKIH